MSTNMSTPTSTNKQSKFISSNMPQTSSNAIPMPVNYFKDIEGDQKPSEGKNKKNKECEKLLQGLKGMTTNFDVARDHAINKIVTCNGSTNGKKESTGQRWCEVGEHWQDDTEFYNDIFGDCLDCCTPKDYNYHHFGHDYCGKIQCGALNYTDTIIVLTELASKDIEHRRGSKVVSI